MLDVWLCADKDNKYDPKLDPRHYKGNVVRVGDKVAGHIDEVLEIRPNAIKVRLVIDGETFPY
jgi:hypothetical protein